MKVAIFGGTGFVGSYIIDELTFYKWKKLVVKKIQSVGLDVSDEPIKVIKVNKEIRYQEGERYISIKPSTFILGKPASATLSIHSLTVNF